MVDNADLFLYFKPVLHSWDILCLVMVLTVLFIFLVPKPETAPITINSKTEKLYLYKENKRIQLHTTV